jgi:hypothetical protein
MINDEVIVAQNTNEFRVQIAQYVHRNIDGGQ